MSPSTISIYYQWGWDLRVAIKTMHPIPRLYRLLQATTRPCTRLPGCTDFCKPRHAFERLCPLLPFAPKFHTLLEQWHPRRVL